MGTNDGAKEGAEGAEWLKQRAKDAELNASQQEEYDALQARDKDLYEPTKKVKKHIVEDTNDGAKEGAEGAAWQWLKQRAKDAELNASQQEEYDALEARHKELYEPTKKVKKHIVEDTNDGAKGGAEG